MARLLRKDRRECRIPHVLTVQSGEAGAAFNPKRERTMDLDKAQEIAERDQL